MTSLTFLLLLTMSLTAEPGIDQLRRRDGALLRGNIVAELERGYLFRTTAGETLVVPYTDLVEVSLGTERITSSPAVARAATPSARDAKPDTTPQHPTAANRVSGERYTWLWVTGLAVTVSGWVAHGIIATATNSRAMPWPWVPLLGPWLSIAANSQSAWAHLLAAAWQYTGVGLTALGLLLKRRVSVSTGGLSMALWVAPSGIGIRLETP